MRGHVTIASYATQKTPGPCPATTETTGVQTVCKANVSVHDCKHGWNPFFISRFHMPKISGVVKHESEEKRRAKNPPVNYLSCLVKEGALFWDGS
jgi:hypothetical protein